MFCAETVPNLGVLPGILVQYKDTHMVQCVIKMESLQYLNSDGKTQPSPVQSRTRQKNQPAKYSFQRLT